MADTLTELLNEWRGRRIGYIHLMRRDYGEDSPEKNKMIMSMEFQLRTCIQELEALTKNPMINLLVKEMLRNDKMDN